MNSTIFLVARSILSNTNGSGIMFLMRGFENLLKFFLLIPRDTNNFEIILFNSNFFSRIF